MNDMEDIIKKLWEEIESFSNDFPSRNPSLRYQAAVKKWVQLFKCFTFTEGQNFEDIEKNSLYLLERFQKRPLDKLLKLVSRSKYPDTSPKKTDASIITFFITALFCFGRINRAGLLSPQNKASENKVPTPISTLSSSRPSGESIQQKYILTMVISAKEANLIDALRSEGHLTPETAENLFRKKQWIGYSSEKNWKYQNLFDETEYDQQKEHDVYYIKTTMDKEDERFGRDSNMLKMYDAFKELSRLNPGIEISERLPKETYENEEFYRV